MTNRPLFFSGAAGTLLSLQELEIKGRYRDACGELPGASGASRSVQELLEASRSSQELPGASMSFQKRPGASRRFQELMGA